MIVTYILFLAYLVLPAYHLLPGMEEYIHYISFDYAFDPNLEHEANDPFLAEEEDDDMDSDEEVVADDSEVPADDSEEEEIGVA